MTYLGAAPTTTASRKSQTTYRYLCTAGQSVISGADLNNNTLACDPLDTEVFMNGLKLDSTDTTITATQVTLAVPAAAGDEIEVVAYRTFESADHYDKSTSDTRYVNAAGDTMTGALTVDADGATPLTVDRATSNGTIVDFQKDGSSVGSIATEGGYTKIIGGNGSFGSGLGFFNLAINARTATGAVADNTVSLGESSNRFKDLYLGGGVYLGGTGASNHLDDYEEGTWTPTILASTSNPSPNYLAQIGTYRKIGKFLYVNCYIYASSLSGGQGNIRLGGLPFGIKGASTGGYPFLMAGYFHMGGQSAGVAAYNTIRWQANASPVTHLDWYGSGGNVWSTGAYEISATGVLPIV